MSRIDPFGARAALGAGLPDYYRLGALGDLVDLTGAPVTVKILLENLLRHAGHGIVRPEDVETLASWRPGVAAEAEIPFMPSRVVLQDFTGVPAIVDLAVMRDAMADLGGDPGKVNPLVPADLVIDHSVQVDRFGTPGRVRLQRRSRVRPQRRALPAAALGADRLPRPARRAARDRASSTRSTSSSWPRSIADRDAADGAGGRVAFPDTVVGTDSHTTMVNGLGVLGYGVGGIEAEAVLLGQPLYQPMPHVVGVRLHGALPRGSTATDLVLVVTEMLRAHGVVGSFVEFAGDGLAGLSLADRATISNMSPEFGATATLFPIDDETLAYLRLTGRSAERVDARRALRQGAGPVARAGRRARRSTSCSSSTSRRVEPSVAGPRRPQDRVPLTALRDNFRSNFPDGLEEPIADLGGEQPIAGDGVVEEASAESFPASDPPSFAEPADGRRRPRHRRPTRSPVPDARSTGGATGRSRSSSTASASRSAPARSRSPRSRRARTRPTRP